MPHDCREPYPTQTELIHGIITEAGAPRLKRRFNAQLHVRRRIPSWLQPFVDGWFSASPHSFPKSLTGES